MICHEENSCYYCGNSPVNFRCGKCKINTYCNKICQRKHWPAHKFNCNTLAYLQPGNEIPPNTFNSLSQIKISIVKSPPISYSYAYSQESEYHVAMGKMEISHNRLFTFGLATCIAIIIWGKQKVIMMHIGAGNLQGGINSHYNINLKEFLPEGFEFLKGIIICGEFIDLQLSWFGFPALVGLTQRIFHQLPFASKMKIANGITADCIVEAKVKDQELIIFRNILPQFSNSFGTI